MNGPDPSCAPSKVFMSFDFTGRLTPRGREKVRGRGREGEREGGRRVSLQSCLPSGTQWFTEVLRARFRLIQIGTGNVSGVIWICGYIKHAVLWNVSNERPRSLIDGPPRMRPLSASFQFLLCVFLLSAGVFCMSVWMASPSRVIKHDCPHVLPPGRREGGWRPREEDGKLCMGFLSTFDCTPVWTRCPYMPVSLWVIVKGYKQARFSVCVPHPFIDLFIRLLLFSFRNMSWSPSACSCFSGTSGPPTLLIKCNR